MKLVVFWVGALCSLVEVNCEESLISLMMGAAGTSEALRDLHQTKQCKDAEESYIHTGHCKNLKPESRRFIFRDI
jgi:hypothetical protein